MKLIAHLGLHKTASTWIQHLLNDNRTILKTRGILYQRQPEYPAHHETAWALLNGDPALFIQMLADAKAAGCKTVILSSEDLESILFVPAVAALIEETALANGVTEIEWHMGLREPGEYFASLYAQLQYHVHADPLNMFREIMAKGALFVPEPLGHGYGTGTPFWYYCFDSLPFIGGFAGRTKFPVFVHDYTDNDPFPCWRMLARIGALGCLIKTPSEGAKNARLPDSVVVDNYVTRVLEMVPNQAAKDAVEPLARHAVQVGQAAVPLYATVISQHFANSYHATLARFAAK